MKNAIPILVIVTAGFAATVLAASTVCRSTVPADPPVAYYQFGDAPEFPTALDSSTNADDGVYEETSTLRVPKLNAPFTMGAWLQSIDDNDDLSGARDVLGEAAIDNYAPRTAQIGSRYQVETAFETGTLISLGLVLILFESIGRWGRSPLEFRGSDATLSRARIFQLGGANLRRRSEAELNSFSACYATARVFHLRWRARTDVKIDVDRRGSQDRLRTGYGETVRVFDLGPRWERQVGLLVMVTGRAREGD